jgi:hypothetical protein
MLRIAAEDSLCLLCTLASRKRHRLFLLKLHDHRPDSPRSGLTSHPTIWSASTIVGSENSLTPFFLNRGVARQTLAPDPVVAFVARG